MLDCSLKNQNDEYPPQEHAQFSLRVDDVWLGFHTTYNKINLEVLAQVLVLLNWSNLKRPDLGQGPFQHPMSCDTYHHSMCTHPEFMLKLATSSHTIGSTNSHWVEIVCTFWLGVEDLSLQPHRFRQTQSYTSPAPGTVPATTAPRLGTHCKTGKMNIMQMRLMRKEQPEYHQR